MVNLLVELTPRETDLLGVGDDDEVARIQVRRVPGAMLSRQHPGDTGREPPEHGTRGVVERFERLLASEARNPLVESTPARDPLGYR